MEAVRKARLCTSRLKSFIELKKKKGGASSDVWVAEVHTFGEDPEFSSLLFL